MCLLCRIIGKTGNKGCKIITNINPNAKKAIANLFGAHVLKVPRKLSINNADLHI
jgi:hypothetical protein